MEYNNIKDKLIQNRFPTVVVPRYGDFEPCPLYQTRLLMARDGVHVETNQLFGRFRGHHADLGRDLPYGDVTGINDFVSIMGSEEVNRIFNNDIRPPAKEHAERNMEWAGWIIWNAEEGYRYLPLEIEATFGSVVIKNRPTLPAGSCLAIDVHSHGRIKPFFSVIDDRDDAGGVKVSVVLGGYSGKDGFAVAGRIAVEGFFFPLFDPDTDVVVTL
ncbi:MAG TPA: PRTRC system protein A [Deltaproteobacteria bacterium]|nr:PRTRC system protein A [Deltaproteobacteria bacterium]